MALAYAKTTELEAVNVCLGTIGERPVNEVPDSGVSTATLARDTVHEVNRLVQEEGLACNQEFKVKLSVSDDEIALPATCISVDPSYLADNHYVERNSKLYDRKNHTYTMTKDIFVDIIYFLEFTDLPEHVRRYVTVLAGRLFQRRWLANGEIEKITEADELKAKRQFVRKESNIADASILDNPHMNPRVFRRQR